MPIGAGAGAGGVVLVESSLGPLLDLGLLMALLLLLSE